MLGIRHTEIRDSESGFGKSDKFLHGLPHFAWEAREHWPGWCPANPRGAEDSRLTPGVVVR